MILKNANNDTCLSETPIEGWTEINAQQLADIQAARRVTPDARALIPPISHRQIRMALTRAGLRAAVEAAVAAGSQDLKDWYEFSTAFERLNPQVVAMGEALSVSPASLDDLWALGAQL